MEDSIPEPKLTRNLQTLSDRVQVSQQSGRKDVILDVKLASGVISDIVKLLALNVELHQQYLENQLIQVELDAGNFIIDPQEIKDK
jgi:hypothetical protein|tara:strand:- start:138 stop:395 length:258 start_codon:yes stop_codon:yes gene_type:complete